MGGFASADFQELAYLGPRVFLYPLVGGMLYNNKCHTGWTIALTYSFFWWLLTIGFDLRDPLPPILLRHGLAIFEEASFIYFAIFPILMFISGVLSGYISRLFDIRASTPWEAIFPSFSSIDLSGLSSRCDAEALAALKEYYCMCYKGLTNGCYILIDPPYWHTFVGFLLQLIILTIPDYIFWYFIPTRERLAVLLPLGLKILGWILAWLYWSYRTDLYVWGPTEWNTRARRDAYNKSPNTSLYGMDPNIDAFDSILFAQTQSLIDRNVFVMAIIDLLGFILIAGVIAVPTVPDVDVVIFVGIGYLALLLLIALFVHLFLHMRRSSQPSLCPRRCPKTGALLSSKRPASTPLDANVVKTPTPINSGNQQQLIVYDNRKRINAKKTDSSIIHLHNFS